MDILRILQQLATALQVTEKMAASLVVLSKSGGSLFGISRPTPSYRNVILALELDICDVEGRLAILRRRQTVEFRTPDAGVIRELLWGDGRLLGKTLAHGADLLGGRREGGRVVQFLGTNPPPAKGERRRIETERVVRDALLGAEEYLEGFAERPTSALKLRVLFPEGRFARTARAEMTPPRSKLRTIRPRIGKDGRAALSWTIRNPDELATYRLAWNW
ncbi:MAG: hypothetical protein KC482_01415 [Dehalococcoidia bacterium]|nr:hypothetical protein [Dehalococcoidia bacterium]